MNPDMDIDPDDQYGDPSDYYEEYSDWLMENVAMICNGDDLVSHIDAGTRFEEFLQERRNGKV